LDEGALLHLSAQHPAHFADRCGFMDGLCHVRRNRDEESHLVLIEWAMFLFPGYQHPQDPVVVDQRYAEKVVVALPTCFRRGDVKRVSRRVIQNKQLPAVSDQAQEPLMPTDANLTHRCMIHSVCSHQYELILLLIRQIHAGDIDSERAFDPANHASQGVIQVRCGADFLHDLSPGEGHQEESFGSRVECRILWVIR
jgi:hypothetical protein